MQSEGAGSKTVILRVILRQHLGVLQKREKDHHASHQQWKMEDVECTVGKALAREPMLAGPGHDGAISNMGSIQGKRNLREKSLRSVGMSPSV